MAIEKAPSISQEDLLSAMLLTPNDKVQEVVNKVNETFEYWDTIKYKRCPEGCTPQQLWTYVKAARVKSMMSVWGKYGITLTLTNQMQRMCHEIDMNWGGSWGTDSIIGDENKEQYLVGSLMEEAIYSSQMEGAATTRKVAKEMLRKKMTPKDKSQQMIANNYQTIQFIVSHKDALLSPELLLQIHQLMTEHTMQNPQEAGCFRSNNDVVVENGITHETVHIPPTYEEIPNFVEDLCRFFNEQDAPQFIHPIIRGIIIHFVAYNMRVLQQSFKQLQDYIKRKQEEKRAANSFLRIGNINARQAQIIKMFADDSNLVVTIADLQAKFLVSPTTAKADVVGLMNMGLLSEISFNKVKKGYIKGEQFDEITKS
jgi:Fic family protein